MADAEQRMGNPSESVVNSTKCWAGISTLRRLESDSDTARKLLQVYMWLCFVSPQLQPS